MTVSYSLNVSKASFAGFLKLLFRWSGSIYKNMWREALVFCFLFVVLQIVLRHCLVLEEKSTAWIVIKYVNSVGEDVPYSFVLGFYVAFVANRWMTQFNTLPWPDRVSHSIVAYVHGSDERSRMIRRTLARYAYLLQILTYQMVSTSVKKRFPTVHSLVEAGLMTAEEMAVYEKVNFSYGKWWLPAHWFTALVVRAKKEGRIKDSVMMKALMQEMLTYRTMCAMTIAYDWISVPLAYTQVATITAYFKAFTLLIGKQTLDVPSGKNDFTVDYYFPFVTIYKFLWTVGWLKVAQQILNPYGEDDDDFELNWTFDRAVQISYDIVDQYHLKHPKVKKDPFWDAREIILPQTQHSAKYWMNPDLGSAFKLVIDEVKYMPMDELCEQDSDGIESRNPSLKRKGTASRQNSSFIRRVLKSGFGQSARQKSRKAAASKSWPEQQQGTSNPAFSMNEELRDVITTSEKKSSPEVKRTSVRNLVKKLSPVGKANSVILKQQNSYSDDDKRNVVSYDRQNSSKSVKIAEAEVEEDESQDDFEPVHVEDVLMPAIPEEAPRNSLASIEYTAAALRGERPTVQMDGSFDVVKEATEILQELCDSTAVQDRWKANESRGYESRCSNASNGDSFNENDILEQNSESKELVVKIEDMINKNHTPDKK